MKFTANKGQKETNIDADSVTITLPDGSEITIKYIEAVDALRISSTNRIAIVLQSATSFFIQAPNHNK